MPTRCSTKQQLSSRDPNHRLPHTSSSTSFAPRKPLPCSRPTASACPRRNIEMNWGALWLTAKLAAIVSALLLAMGIPIAYWLTYSRWRWKFLVEAIVALPIVLPPTVLGFYVLIALGSRSPLGRWWESLTGHTLAFTFEGLVIGSLLYSLPFAVQPFAAAFSMVDREL